MAVATSVVRCSTLNPNAPLFVPAAYQQVEDFSPEWWDLVKTTPWFRDYWFHQHQDQENFDGDEHDEYEDVADLLPDFFDLGIDEAIQQESAYEKQMEKKMGENEMEALIRSLSLKSPTKAGASVLEAPPIRYHEKPLQYVSPKPSPRRIIHQPR